MAQVDAGVWLYSLLLLLRVVLAFGPGYIHPDEWFQFGEVVSGDYFDLDILRTWEFDPSYPCRSMASLRLFSLPFALIGSTPSARLLFIASRATFLLYSFAIDWSAWQLLPRSSRWRGLSLWAGSGVALAFSARSFSNNIEAALLALCLVALQRLERIAAPIERADTQGRDKPAVKTAAQPNETHGQNLASWYLWSSLLGLFFSLGVFSRFTFVIFVLPTGISFVRLAWMKSSGSGNRHKAALQLLLGAALSAAVTAALHILYDTSYFASSPSASLWPPTIAPFNAALYNLKGDNLAIHGLHPRSLHVTVNAPMILGVGPWLNCLSIIVPVKSDGRKVASMTERVLVTTIFSSLLILSIQPHQEPRFLLPLVLPACLLFATSLSANTGIVLSWTVLQYLGVTIFFGLLHQGGVIPAMLNVHGKLRSGLGASNDAPLPLLFWRSFMPPRHLILPVGSSDAVVLDYQSKPVEELVTAIATSASPLQVIFAPSWALNRAVKTSLRSQGIALSPLTRPLLHLDTDHLAESYQEYQRGQSLWNSFSYSAWMLSRIE